ncbi:hypothetical protein AB4305_33540 [Nocardia sp. 2YAB30]|uniref:hypothetical protein n=1 Tax=Nocardia sp. 2YAB30 TaxID=3233022 RepID=UPI003F98A2E9
MATPHPPDAIGRSSDDHELIVSRNDASYSRGNSLIDDQLCTAINGTDNQAGAESSAAVSAAGIDSALGFGMGALGPLLPIIANQIMERSDADRDLNFRRAELDRYRPE